MESLLSSPTHRGIGEHEALDETVKPSLGEARSRIMFAHTHGTKQRPWPPPPPPWRNMRSTHIVERTTKHHTRRHLFLSSHLLPGPRRLQWPAQRVLGDYASLDFTVRSTGYCAAYA